MYLFFLQLLTVIATILERNPELDIQQCIDLDEVSISDIEFLYCLNFIAVCSVRHNDENNSLQMFKKIQGGTRNPSTLIFVSINQTV